jgi:Peroxiredoxin
MKKVSFLLLIIVWVSSRQQQKINEYTITGTVTPDYTGLVYLQEYKNRKYITIDSAEISDGKFILSGSVPESRMYVLTPVQNMKRVQIFLDTSPVALTLNSNWEIESVEGSENAELFHAMQPLSSRGTLNTDSLLSANPASPVGVYFLTREIYRYDYNALRALRDKIDASLNNHPYVTEVDEILAKLEKLQPGQMAPPFRLAALNGDSLSLSSLRGKYVLVDFWASWCPDCRKAHPRLVQLYEEYKDKNFTVLGVSIDEEKDRWKAAIEKDGLLWDQVIAENGWQSGVMNEYAIRWVPTSILIDPEGVIVARSIELSDIENKLEDVLL